ncbi:hypothetical protein ABZS95_43765 [Streptomyces sp. NPDC005479]|uniref:hypothetical protein n=1 Tax=Streptomyces sp. NPDC005479 TaxID=3154879 RepID=UPI0033A34561
MIAEDAQPPVRGREFESRPGTLLDALRTTATDASAGATGQLPAGQSASRLEGGVERAAAALKRH